MDSIAQALVRKDWTWGDSDPAALEELRSRIAETGRRQDLMTYKRLVHGVLFRIPTVEGGTPFHMDLADGRELDRAILGSFLGRLCVDSYRAGQFMASALVVTDVDRRPGRGFGRLMLEIGAIRSTRPAVVEDFWLAQVQRAHAWYVGQPV